MCEIGWLRADAPQWIHDTAEFMGDVSRLFIEASWRDKVELIVWVPILAVAGGIGMLGGLTFGLFQRAKPWLYEAPEVDG